MPAQRFPKIKTHCVKCGKPRIVRFLYQPTEEELSEVRPAYVCTDHQPKQSPCAKP